MNRKFRMGIDIDGTVTCPTALVPYLQKSFNEKFKYEDITEYDLSKVLNIPESEIYQWFKAYEHEMYQFSPVHKDADLVLTEWSNYYNLIFISARHTYLETLTINWFKEHNVPYHHIELTGSHKKIETAKQLQVDAFFEDKLDNAIDIHEALNIPVYLFDTPYNQSTLPEGVKRVKTWLELNQLIKHQFPY
ncbi:5' nucleotidase, NT5C type [Macrococcus animalis]|uniref:5' nucleotidase, NT5C type n=1 Tax=Macrococcus animalis TaxID=3395467 RepID=UPI0039BFB700